MTSLWAALSNDEVIVSTVANPGNSILFVGDMIKTKDGKVYGVTKMGTKDTALCVLARAKTPMERFT